MRSSLKNSLFILLFLSATTVVWADPDWTFLPSSSLFKPLIASPREPITSIVAYLDQVRYEGEAGTNIEFVRYSPQDDVQFAWGIYASGLILLDQDGATFPMRDADFYIGTYFSAVLSDFSMRLSAEHESTHLGDSLQLQQIPLFYSQTVTYTRENVDFTLSFQPFDAWRVYAGAGVWDDPLFDAGSDPMFSEFGTEIYSPDWSVDHSYMRAYTTGSLQWVGDTGVWNKEVQLGVQWKASRYATRDIRIALLFYSGNSQWGQFYNQFDEHLGLATFFGF